MKACSWTFVFFFCTGGVGKHSLVVKAQGDALVQPTTIDSSGGLLDTTITMQYGDFSFSTYSFTNARLFNGLYPGPTIRIRAGDTVKILFQNNLEYQSGAVQSGTNIFHQPDNANLHWHGSHVQGTLPSDDVRLSVAPGDSYQYEVTFPTNHMAGTHWIHPHVHGSSALQVGGGAAMALIVQDESGTLPTEISDASDMLLVVHEMDIGKLNDVISEIVDSKLGISNMGSSNAFRTVNGQFQPKITMAPGEWQRWRIVWAGWLGNLLNLQIDSANCEMQLLAKDGIYISDFPRTITKATIPTGGRADIMVRCSTAETVNVLDFDSTLMTIEVTGTVVASSALSAWTPTYPAYLTDLTSTSADSGCSCSTAIRPCTGDNTRFCINDNSFDSSLYLHTIAFGSVVQRTLQGQDKHPYHQHVYPYQLISGPADIVDADELIYYKVGDWHDVVSTELSTGNMIVRYKADVHVGHIMLHCHILTHEDEGAMSQELVIDGGTCECDALISTSSPTVTPGPPSSTPSPTPSPTTPTTTLSPTANPCCAVAVVAGVLFGEKARDAVQGWVENSWFG